MHVRCGFLCNISFFMVFFPVFISNCESQSVFYCWSPSEWSAAGAIGRSILCRVIQRRSKQVRLFLSLTLSDECVQTNRLKHWQLNITRGEAARWTKGPKSSQGLGLFTTPCAGWEISRSKNRLYLLPGQGLWQKNNVQGPSQSLGQTGCHTGEPASGGGGGGCSSLGSPFWPLLIQTQHVACLLLLLCAGVSVTSSEGEILPDCAWGVYGLGTGFLGLHGSQAQAILEARATRIPHRWTGLR